MDISETTAPKSDQLNADDLMGGPATVTIVEVRAGNSEQPVDIVTAEFGAGRPYKPSKSMRRVLLSAWGKETAPYAGRRMTLYRDPTVKFGGDVVGGIKISHLSHIDKPIRIALTVTRGKRSMHVIDPLPDAPPARDWVADIAQAATMGDLAALYGASPKTPDIVAAKDARKAELQAVDAELLPEADQ